MGTQPAWLRGIASLAVLAALTGAALVSPAVAGGTVTKKQAKKIANQVVTKRAKEFLGNTTVITNKVNVAADTGAMITVICPAGQQAIGGGVSSPHFGASPMEALFVQESGPLVAGTQATGWTTEVVFSTGGVSPIEATGYVVCAP
jgi:hypothetical protein